MSWRIWLGSDRKDWAETNLCDFPDLYSMCEDAAWQNPIKAYAPEPEIMKRFLLTIWVICDFGPERFSDIKIGDVGSWKPFEFMDEVARLKDRYSLPLKGVCK